MANQMMTHTTTDDGGLLALLLGGERFWPTDPHSIEELGLTEPFLDSLISKLLLSCGNSSGRAIATEVCLPFRIVESTLERLRQRRLVTHCGSGSLNDYVYGLTNDGRSRARTFHAECSYVGPAPVPLTDYVISVEAQAICDKPIRRTDLLDSFHDISVASEMLDMLGPAVNSGSGMFLYGAPGNGKSTIANRITSCFGQEIWLPRCVIDGRQIITLFDSAYHHEVEQPLDGTSSDKRWIRVRRPTVVVGGELTTDNLEIRHDPSPTSAKLRCR
jgi:predicted ATPase with chaperone activity